MRLDYETALKRMQQYRHKGGIVMVCPDQGMSVCVKGWIMAAVVLFGSTAFASSAISAAAVGAVTAYALSSMHRYLGRYFRFQDAEGLNDLRMARETRQSSRILHALTPEKLRPTLAFMAAGALVFAATHDLGHDTARAMIKPICQQR